MTRISINGVTHTSSPDFEFYKRFVKLRQLRFWDRYTGRKHGESEDHILDKYRFTNVYRVLDRTTQDLIVRQNYSGSNEDVVFRTLLFKLFNLTSTFDSLHLEFGTNASSFKIEEYEEHLGFLYNAGETLYSNAYVIHPANGYGAQRKYANTLRLVDDIMSLDIVDVVCNSSMEEQYNYLSQFESFGPFMAYQMCIDFAYTPLTDATENDFVVPGPGAVAGIKKCFPTVGKRDMPALIHKLVETQEEWKLPSTMTLYGRELHAIDVQNCFCELNKYSRIHYSGGKEGRNRVFSDPKPIADLVLPEKWGLNFEPR